MAKTIKNVEIVSLEVEPEPLPVTRENLLLSLRGCHVTIPDLQSMIGHWPQGVHPEVKRLEKYVQDTIASILPSPINETRFRTLEASNFALFAASWWPYAPYEALEIGTCLAIWLFAWDDETDSPEYSTIVNDWDECSTFRQKTMDYLQESLSGNSQSNLSAISTNPIITAFRPVGEAISKSCDNRQISMFLNELLYFVQMCGEEQKLQMAHRLPTVEEYIRRRLGSGAVRIMFATTEYAYDITLSQEILDDEAMQRLCEEANILICITNDLLSLKKEVALSQVDSMIPLLSLELGSVQAAINHATEAVRSSIQKIDAAEAEILARYSSTPEVREDIRKFIEGCKYACTCNLNWSLITGRYKLDCQSMKGGLHMTL
ncbi:terpenoid synthase [Jackrogersella minutella]|nr:terpenoid synthase [Jackrogersella minutella]